MGSSIVMESRSFPSNQWLIVLAYTACFTGLFFFTVKVWFQVPLAEIANELKQWRKYALIGMLWDINYLFILLSAPYLPNVVQVVLAQFQSVIVAWVDSRVLGVELNKRKWVCILATIGFGLSSLCFSTQSSKEPVSKVVFWALMFLFNVIAGAFASLCTEVVLKVKKDESLGFDTLKEVTMLNMCSNLYGMCFSILGVPLALYSLRSPPFGSADNEGAFELLRFAIFTDPNILYFVLMVVSSFIYTIASGAIVVHESAMFSAMCSSFGTMLQLLFFCIPVVAAEFDQKFDLPSFLLAVCITIAAAIYTATSDKTEMNKLEASTIGQFFHQATQRRLDPKAPVMAFSVYAVSWIAIVCMLYNPFIADPLALHQG